MYLDLFINKMNDKEENSFELIHNRREYSKFILLYFYWNKHVLFVEWLLIENKTVKLIRIRIKFI